jgi:ComF family protein
MLVRGAHTAKFVVVRTANQLLNWVYPEDGAICIVCKRPMLPREHANDYVWETLQPPGVCAFCLTGQPCDTRRPIVGRVSLQAGQLAILCAAPYEGWLRDALRHWKYDGSLQLTDWFATLMVTAVKQIGLLQWDYIVPVPTARDRKKKRGYDHVGILSQRLSHHLNIPRLSTLSRVSCSVPDAEERLTQSQTTRSRAERSRALLGKFQVTKSAVDLCGKNLLLVDDVVTTGATMQACANLLANSKANRIHALAIVHVQ